MARTGTESNRREIAGAACELVATGGLDSVSMRRIAQHLGSTTGYISHYYADKEELLEAALLSALDELTVRSTPPPTNLDEWVDTAVAILPHDGEVLRFWRVLTAFQAASMNSPRLSAVLSAYAPDREAALARLLAVEAPEGTPEAEIGTLARSILLLVSGLGTTSTITPEAFSRKQQKVAVRAAVYALVHELADRRSAVPRVSAPQRETTDTRTVR